MERIGIFPFDVYIIHDCANSQIRGEFPSDIHVKVGQEPGLVDLG